MFLKGHCRTPKTPCPFDLKSNENNLRVWFETLDFALHVCLGHFRSLGHMTSTPGSQNDGLPPQPGSGAQSLPVANAGRVVWIWPLPIGAQSSSPASEDGRSSLPVPGSIPSPSPGAAHLAREQATAKKVESLHSELLANLKQLTTRPARVAFTPEEIVGILNFLYVVDQHFVEFQVTAKELERIGLPNLTQRLKQIADEIGDSIKIYSEMYKNTANRRSDWERMLAEAGVYARNNFLAANQLAQQAADRWVTQNNSHNESGEG